MNTSPRIGQVRCSVFISQFIGYTPENVEKFRPIFMPDVEQSSVQISGVVSPGQFNTPLQYGMPWNLSRNLSGQNENEIVSFVPGKIDYVLNQTGSISDIVPAFINRCERAFNLVANLKGIDVNRIAFCPLHSIRIDEDNPASLYWENILKRTSSNGIPCQNIEVNYLLKNNEIINGKDVTINFLHQIKDGFHLVNGKKDEDCIIIVLDINTAVENNRMFSIDDMHSFWEKCPDWEKFLLENIF